mmetsp:Transcript_4869/g.18030  ORF Transcript_4869/g.18030 Transcript_4869/m.18030 type:complete len:331 (-) Transcript_4869:469-1461(-)
MTRAEMSAEMVASTMSLWCNSGFLLPTPADPNVASVSASNTSSSSDFPPFCCAFAFAAAPSFVFKSLTRSANLDCNHTTSGFAVNDAHSPSHPGVDSRASRKRTPNSRPLPLEPTLLLLPKLLLPLSDPFDTDGDPDAPNESETRFDPDPPFALHPWSFGPALDITASAPSAACVYWFSCAPGVSVSSSPSISFVFCNSHSASAPFRAGRATNCNQLKSASTPSWSLRRVPFDRLDDFPESCFFTKERLLSPGERAEVCSLLVVVDVAASVAGAAFLFRPSFGVRPFSVRLKFPIARYTLTRCKLDGISKSRSKSCSVRRSNRYPSMPCV